MGEERGEGGESMWGGRGIDSAVGVGGIAALGSSSALISPRPRMGWAGAAPTAVSINHS